MLEIKNKQKFPVQVLVRSRTAPSLFTTLIVPGIGAGKNVIYIEDERATEIIERVEKKTKWISTRYIPNKSVEKGE